jgi:HK97 gp10 family phage protein
MLKGLEQFERQLKELEEKMRGEALRKALLAAVQPVISAAAAAAPTRTGHLKQSMTAQIMPSAPGEAIVRVGPGRPEGSHGILLEYGTVHMTPRPFLAVASEATFQEVLGIFEIQIGEIIG